MLELVQFGGWMFMHIHLNLLNPSGPQKLSVHRASKGVP
jgi:hypothetical protein